MKKLLIRDKTAVGIAAPQMFPTGPVDLGLIQRHLKRVEALGYQSAWTQHGVFATNPSIDPFTLLAYAAACTSRIKLGISVIVLPFYDPVNLAKMSASLDQLSGGRFILGVGIGGGRSRYPSFGFNDHHRVKRFEDAIALLRCLWSESQVNFENEFWNLERVSINPKPLQKPNIPIWFGASADPALKRATRLGDGFMGAGTSDITTFQKVLSKLRSYLAHEGRTGITFPISKRVYIAVDRDREAASKKIQKWFANYYHDASLGLKATVFGTEDEVIEQLTPLVEEGLDMIMFNPVYDLIEQAEKLSELIIPKL